ncbi:hypothetical protein PEC18_05345 [Paucibacter sp. O1-1]|nr:hypothetical protein [Paucibacter sp. O1-1]MDA3825294.1 hypothetical protein [Paucibacter sp. O1-1]
MHSGKTALHLQLNELRDFSRDLNHSANRLSGSMVIAALIVGSSITMTVEGGPTLLGLPFFGLLGFLGASIAGIWLLWSILRSGEGVDGSIAVTSATALSSTSTPHHYRDGTVMKDVVRSAAKSPLAKSRSSVGAHDE